MATKLASKSEHLYKRARELIPGGVNSPVRAYSPYPLFVSSAKRSRFRTVDGEEFLDYCMAYGALLDGHAQEEVAEAVHKALSRGSLFGHPAEREVELASLILSVVPSREMVRAVHLERVRKIIKRNGVVLVFEEVIKGFRIALGGAQEYFRIRPDMTVLGKILGGGLPIAAFGGRREIMEKLAPLGGVYQAGTYSGNPVSVAASLAMLQSLKRRAGQLYPKLEKTGPKLQRGISDLVESAKLTAQVNGLSSMFQVFFTEHQVTDYDSAKTSDTTRFNKYFQSLLASRVFVPPSQFETCFLATSQTEYEIQSTL